MVWLRVSGANTSWSLASQRSAEVVRDAKQRASEIIAQAEKRAAEIVDEAKGAAKGEGDRILVGARAEVEQEVFRAREALRQQVAELALAGASKILAPGGGCKGPRRPARLHQSGALGYG